MFSAFCLRTASNRRANERRYGSLLRASVCSADSFSTETASSRAASNCLVRRYNHFISNPPLHSTIFHRQSLPNDKKRKMEILTFRAARPMDIVPLGPLPKRENSFNFFQNDSLDAKRRRGSRGNSRFSSPLSLPKSTISTNFSRQHLSSLINQSISVQFL